VQHVQQNHQQRAAVLAAKGKQQGAVAVVLQLHTREGAKQCKVIPLVIF